MPTHSPPPLTVACPTGMFRTLMEGRSLGLRETFQRLRERCCAPATPDRYGGTIAVSGDPQDGYWELVYLHDKVFLVISDCRYAQPRTETVLPEGFIELHFVLQGEIQLALHGQRQIRVHAPTFTTIRQGEGVGYQVVCAAERWRSVALYVERDFMQHFLHDVLELDAWSHSLSHPPHTQCQHLRLDVRTLTAVEQLLANPYSGQRRLLYFDAKVTEILCAAVERWQLGPTDTSDTQEAPTDEGERLSDRDVLLLDRARELLIADLSCPPTIAQLARAVGVNTSKLKRGFKYLNGMTIFEYAHHHRMQHALHLLCEEHQPVGQVAEAVGYQHQTSFAAAFKAHFGFTPKQARHIACGRWTT